MADEFRKHPAVYRSQASMKSVMPAPRNRIQPVHQRKPGGKTSFFHAPLELVIEFKSERNQRLGKKARQWPLGVGLVCGTLLLSAKPVG